MIATGPRSFLRALLLAVACLMPVAMRSSLAQVADSALARVARLAASGDRTAARALADSVLATTQEQTPRHAEALYWRAYTSSNAADAERDYRRVSLEYPLSPRAPDALLLLAQLEYARGDHDAARRRFDRLLREYPTGRHVPRASYWSARLALEAGDRAAGCASLAIARRSASRDDVELQNQIEYFTATCAEPVRDSLPGAAAPDSSRATPTRADSTSGQFSVQVAAFQARADASALASRLKRRGFDVRVVGTRAPYRVRIGRYETRAAASAALERMKRSQVRGIVVEAEPR